MTEPQKPPCGCDPMSCCGTPETPAPPRRSRRKLFLFILILLVGAALAGHSLLAKKDACCPSAGCSEPCGE
jgi:hypothetical protein